MKILVDGNLISGCSSTTGVFVKRLYFNNLQSCDLLEEDLPSGCSSPTGVFVKSFYFNNLQIRGLLDGYLMETHSKAGLWG